MDKGLSAEILEQFSVDRKSLNTYSPLVLAYIGDAVFDLVIRTILVGNGNTSVEKLHGRASRLVKAESQAKMIKAILPGLTEEETSVYRRGRNSKPHTRAKNATVGQYLEATGFESLIGWLYLQDDWDRIFALMKQALADFA